MKTSKEKFVEYPRLGRLPADWSVCKFCEVTEPVRDPADVVTGTIYREIGIRSHGKGIFHKEPVDGAELGDKRVFWVRPNCLTFNIVFAWEGAVATTSSDEEGMIGSHRFPMHEPRPGVADVEFLRRFFQTQIGIRLLGDASPGGAGRNRTLNQKLLADTQIPLPPLPEQRKIADILSAVDEMIETTDKVIEQLQVTKKAVMQELLTRGVPSVHTRFKKTEIGDVPEEWALLTLGAAGRWLSGGTPSKQDEALWSGDVPWVSPKDMKRSRISDAIDHVAREALGKGTQLAPVGSLLMVVRGMILAHSFPVAITTAPVAFNQDIKALVANECFSPEFLLYWLELRSGEILNLADVANHGTKRLPSELLFATPVPKPGLVEQRDIVTILRAIDERREAELIALRNLRAAKSALTSVLLTGELRVTPNKDAA